jgi:PTS system N-acetylglucosamine-specific IIC component
MMRYLQKLGKSLMLPVACLPVAAILMGIGYWIDPSGWGANNIVAAFLLKAWGAIIDNMPILFAIGVGVGMSKDGEGTAALAALISWLMIQTLLSPASYAMFTGGEAPAAFGRLNNQFIGIVSGLIGAACYNRFHMTKLPDALAFFLGRRCVAIITVGAGIYGFLNRLLIPIGLHHALNSVFWFDVAGINDLGKFWSGAGGVLGVTGQYITGFFPVMMFGLPAACLAMYREDQQEEGCRRALVLCRDSLVLCRHHRTDRVFVHVPRAGALSGARGSDRHLAGGLFSPADSRGL